MKVDLGQNVRLVVLSFRYGVSSFRQTDILSRLVIFRGRLGELPVQLAVLIVRFVGWSCLSFRSFVMSFHRFVMSFRRFVMAFRRFVVSSFRLDHSERL